MIQCLSVPTRPYDGVRGATSFENMLAYCGAGVAGRCGAGVDTYMKNGLFLEFLVLLLIKATA